MLHLDAATRERHMAAMAERLVDVLVIGGGITGAGVALDAASRGLSVALVEREDFAAGTSGRSSRLIHGGARYLRYGDVGLVYEALRERARLLRLAPHLVRPLGFLIPIRRWPNRVYMGAGLYLYDTMAAGRNIRRHRWARPDEVAVLTPSLKQPSGGYISWDCRTDDARLTLEIVRRAAAHGAAVANHAQVQDLTGVGFVTGAQVEDRITGSTFHVRARLTVNATGAWADRVNGLAAPPSRRLRPSKGVHVVLERPRLPIRCAVMVPSLIRDGSLVFAIPWGPRVYAGTTDTAYHGDLDAPTVDPQDVEVVLGSLDRAFGGDLGPTDVRASWAGIRPLLDTGRGSTRDLSRRHVVYEEPPGLITVTGGKLTTYRAMAEEVVDRLCRHLGRGGRCRTTAIPLGLTRPLGAELERATAAAGGLGLDREAGARLVARYGDDWDEALTLVREGPSLGEDVLPGLPVMRVELHLARIREMALTEEDVLERRTRLATMEASAAASLAGSVLT
jgi:glycerol-3-phosphate dehydrogenase